MAYIHSSTAFVVRPMTSSARASEFQQSMRPHPLVHQELPHDPTFGVYNRRLRSLEYGNVSTEELYWCLRQRVGLSHTGELATEVRGPDAEAMLNRVFTRDIAKVRVGRCSYQIACFSDGGMVMDGVLMRLAPQRFWYVQGDGEFPTWLRAHSQNFDVQVAETRMWISQVQGPRSLEVLAQVADEGFPERFRYFDLAHIHIAGQPVVISRTGFTGELGWELYFGADVDADRIGERLMQAGEIHGIHTIPAAATNARRIEAGLLFAGTDFDDSMTPFEVGFGAMVDLDKPDFIGQAALAQADRRRRTWGLQCRDSAVLRGDTLYRDGEPAGRVSSSAWSPYLQSGIAIVHLTDPELGPGTVLQAEGVDGQHHEAYICELPMYDPAGEIPRGKRVEIPMIPGIA